MGCDKLSFFFFFLFHHAEMDIDASPILKL